MKINSTLDSIHSLKWVSLIISTSLLFSVNASWAKGEITEVFTEAHTAIQSSYSKDGVFYQWGNGHDLVINGFTYQGATYDYQQIADRVNVKQVNNPRASGDRCSVFVETAGSSLNYSPSYPATKNAQGHCDMGQMIAGNVLNVGALDIFSNGGERPDSMKNIERIDFIVDNGISAEGTTEGLELSGQVVIEKSGNNPLQIAAITALDRNGEPSAYGSLTYINHAESDASTLRYGITDIDLKMDFLANENSDNPGYLAYTNSQQEKLGMVFISQADLGLAVGQQYFGFSLFPSDVNASHTLTNPASFPSDSTDTDLLGPGDADFFAAFALRGGLNAENRAPLAKDDFASTATGESVSTNILANDIDPDGDALTAQFISQPVNGSITLSNGIASYTPNEGFSGTDSVNYKIDDGQGGWGTATLKISVTAVESATSGRIATGLQGHGAGSFSGIFLMFLSIMRLLKTVRTKKTR